MPPYLKHPSIEANTQKNEEGIDFMTENGISHDHLFAGSDGSKGSRNLDRFRFFGLRAIFVANETSLFNNIRVNTKGCTLLCGSSAHSDKIEQDVLNGQNRSGKTNSNFNVSQDPFRREQNDQLTQRRIDTNFLIDI